MAYRYIRYEVVPIPEFLVEIRAHWNENRVRVQRPDGRWVGCTSLRLKTFAHGAKKDNEKIICVGCGLEATHFAVESSPGQNHTHMNLYGLKKVNEKFEEILFTHDHIRARALGGADNLSNLQVMCAPCNSKKSIEEGRQVRLLREKSTNA
jgi:hypothetical protein